MNYADAYRIAEDLRQKIAPACEPGLTLIVGSLRRKKSNVHDIEIAGKPILGAPRPTFGDPKVFETRLDQILYSLEMEGELINGGKNGSKMKKYIVNTEPYGFETLNPFYVEFYLATPPAQWGVECVIRTGPGSEDDNFSRWCVTTRSQGGALPDGYRQRHLAIWSADQLDGSLEPRKGEEPIPMPTEEDFFKFLNLPYIMPAARHARWRH